MSAAKLTPLALGPLVRVSVAGSPSFQMRVIARANTQGRDDGVALVTIRTPFDEERAALLAAAPEMLDALGEMLELIGDMADNIRYTDRVQTLEASWRALKAKATGSAA